MTSCSPAPVPWAQQPPAQPPPCPQELRLAPQRPRPPPARSRQQELRSGTLCTAAEQRSLRGKQENCRTCVRGRATGFGLLLPPILYPSSTVIAQRSRRIPSISPNLSTDSVKTSHPSSHFLSSVLTPCFTHSYILMLDINC